MDIGENEILENPVASDDVAKQIEKELVESNFEAQCYSFKTERDAESAEKFLTKIFFPLLQLGCKTPLPLSFYFSARQVYSAIFGQNGSKELRGIHTDLLRTLVQFSANKCGDPEFPVCFLEPIVALLSKKLPPWLANINLNLWKTLFDKVPQFHYLEEKIAQPFLVMLISDLFIELGAIKKITLRLERPETSIEDFYTLVYILKILVNYWDIDKKPTDGFRFSQLEKHLIAILETKIQSFTVEQCKGPDFKQLLEIIDFVKGLLKMQGMKNSSLDYLVNTTQVKVSFKWLKLPYIQKRVKALLCINQFCEKKFAPQQDPVKETLIALCKEENILQYLFKESPHPELTKKCSPLLQFMIDNEIFSETEIDTIWASSVDKHESIMHEVWKLFSELTLPKDLLDYLYLKVGSIPSSIYDEKFVEFAKILTGKAVIISNEARHQKSWYGLDLFWEQAIMQGGNENVKNLFLLALVDCLSKDHFEIRRVVYLEYSLENLSKYDNFSKVKNSLILIREILGLIPSPFTRENDLKGLAIWLNNSEHRIVEKIFSIIYHSQSDLLFSQDLAASRDLLVFLLEFLEFFLPLSDENKIEAKQIDILWHHLAHDRYLISDDIYNWLERICNTGFVSNETLHYIFISKFPEIDKRLLSLAGFSLFETLFRLNNIIKKNIEIDQAEYLILTFNLSGLEELWEIAFLASNQEVHKKVITLLSNIQRNLNKPLRTGVNVARRAILDRCMLRLSSEKDLDAIGRCLEIFVELIENFQANRDPLLQHGYSATKKTYSVKYFEMAYGLVSKEDFDISIMDNLTVEELRSLISEKVGEDPKKIKLLVKVDKNVEVPITNMQQRIYRLPQTTTIIAKKNSVLFSKPTQATDYNNNEYQAYSSLLSEPEYFDCLFEKLNLPPPLCERVWDLLMKLPTNSIMESKFLHVNAETDWSSLLSPNNVYKLCYSLQIIDSIKRNSEHEKWEPAFIKFRGLEYFINELIPSSRNLLDPMNGTQRFTCIKLLLRTIVSMSIDSSAEPPNIKEVAASMTNTSIVVQMLVDIIIAVSSIPPLSPNENNEISSIIRYSLVWLGPLLSSDRCILDSFLSHQSFDKWSEVTLLNTSREIRSTASKLLGVAFLLSPDSHFILLLYTKLISLFEVICRNYRFYNPFVDCFFDFFLNLARFSYIINSEVLIQTIIDIMKNNRYIYIENEYNDEKDFVYEGFLKVALQALKSDPNLKQRYGPFFIQEVCDVGLFELPRFGSEEANTDAPKCKYPSSRQFAYYFLFEMCIQCPDNYLLIVNKLSAIQNTLGFPSYWDLSPASFDSAYLGYAGLKNLGATCYMNSLFQQLFMLPEFCERILSAPCLKDDTNLLYQLQLLIANLKGGLKKAYSTTQFCMTYKDRDGQVVNPFIQMDVDEFFAILFDRIETLLKGTPQEKLLNEIFGGETVNQIISLECPHTTERVEPFFTLSVEVKNQAKLEKSLELFIQDDILEGDNKYHCSQCNAKVSAKKRCLLKTLPQNLIIHLKRFDYDLALDKRSKVTQRCEFPSILNLEPFSVDGANRKDNKESEIAPVPQDYKLVGVLVHRGTTDSGHYYSFIKERKGENWFQFNDDNVSPFSPDHIPDECFGDNNNFSKSNSAYMLFYEKCESSKPIVSLNLSNDIFQSVRRENQQFLTEKLLFEPPYIEFMEKLLELPFQNQGLSNELMVPTLKVGIVFLFKIASHYRQYDIENWSKLALCLVSQMQSNSEVCHWFITEAMSNNWVYEMFALCPNIAYRNTFCEFFHHALLNVFLNSSAMMKESRPINTVANENSNENMDIEINVPADSLASNFLEYYLDLSKRFRFHAEYYWVIIMHLQIDVSFSHKIAASEFFRVILTFYLQLGASEKSKIPRLSTNEKHHLLLSLFRIISTIVLFSQIPPSSEIEEDKANFIIEPPPFVLPKFALEILLGTSAQKKPPPNFFIQTLINLEEADKDIFQMLVHLCHNNMIYTQNICQALQEDLFQYTGEDLEKVLKIIGFLVGIPDAHQNDRIQLIVSLFFAIVEDIDEDVHDDDVQMIFQYYSELLKNCPQVQNCFWVNFESWTPWIYDNNKSRHFRARAEFAFEVCSSGDRVEKSRIFYLLKNFLIGRLNGEVANSFNSFLFSSISMLISELSKKEILQFLQQLPQIFEKLNQTVDTDNNPELPICQINNMKMLFTSFLAPFFYHQESSPHAKLNADPDIMGALFEFLKTYPILISLSFNLKKTVRTKSQEALLNAVYSVLIGACKMNKDVIKGFVENDYALSNLGYLCQFIIFDQQMMSFEPRQKKDNFGPLETFFQDFVLKEEAFITYACKSLVLELLKPREPNPDDIELEHKIRISRFWGIMIELSSFQNKLDFISYYGLLGLRKYHFQQWLASFLVIFSELSKNKESVPVEPLKTQFEEIVPWFIKFGIANSKMNEEFASKLIRLVLLAAEILPQIIEVVITCVCASFKEKVAARKNLLTLLSALFERTQNFNFEKSTLISVFETLTSYLVAAPETFQLLLKLVNFDDNLIESLGADKIESFITQLHRVKHNLQDASYISLRQKLDNWVEKREKEASDSELTQELIMVAEIPDPLDPSNIPAHNTD